MSDSAGTPKKTQLFARRAPRVEAIMLVGVLLSVLPAVVTLADTQPRSLDEWQLLHDYLRAEILRHSDQYPRAFGGDTLKNSCEPYLRALEVFAADRSQALTAAQEAQASHDPAVQAFFDKFMDLVDLAQDFGDGALQMADIMLRVEDNFGPIPGATLTLRVDLYARCLYDNARRLQFDEGITRRQVQRMLEKAIDDLDQGWSLTCGEIHEAVYCGWMYPDLERNPDPFYVEERLREADKVREQAPYYELGSERQRADELMNRYLKDTLCLNPARGHKWYLQLAEQYQLNNAREYIDGFYAKLHGNVWIEEAGQRRPANGARVTVTDPKDQTTWRATADAEGYYEIERGLLHNHKGKDAEDRCPVFKISAEHEGDRVDDTYEGPLREPDRSAEHTKDLVIQRDERWELKIEYREQVSYDHREEHSDGDTTTTMEEHITGTLDYRITASLKPASWQPADALRPYQATEEEAKAQFAQPRPDDVPSTTGEQLEQIEREEARMRERANEVVGPGGMHYFIALGVGIQLKDDFVHTKNITIMRRDGWRYEDDYRGEWHADQQGPIPLNIRLKTYANENSYHITLTDHDPMDTGNPEAHHPFTIPWRYLVRHTSTGQPPLNCSGTAEVEDNFPHNVFADVPDDKLAYDGSQRVLRGEHSWTEGASQLDVSGMETPMCTEKRALRANNRSLPADSVTKTLKWTLRRMGGPGIQ